jgi:hypothetical protein
VAANLAILQGSDADIHCDRTLTSTKHGASVRG